MSEANESKPVATYEAATDDSRHWGQARSDIPIADGEKNTAAPQCLQSTAT